ncbi:helix-turn-helix domain-containing protein [Nocardioides montaniterrae]
MTDTTASVEVRRNVPLAAAVGTIAGLLAIAFAVRAFGGGSALDWLALGVLALITIAYVVTLVDARAPLMVVDERGVRLREGAKWQGLGWDEIDCFEHLPRRLPLRDGHLLVVSHDDHQLIVPLTMATVVVGADLSGLSDTLADLSGGRADVVEVVPGIEDGAAPDAPLDAVAPVEPPAPAEHVTPTEDVAPLTEDTAPIAADAADDEDLVSTGEIPAVTEDVAEDATEVEEVEEVAEVEEPPTPGRTTILAARVDMPGTAEPRRLSDLLGDPAPAPAAPAAPAYDENATVVLEELAVRPAARPVVGPELARARQELGLTIDQLSERTRIRPHVIEAIEVDDFAPCGGDFYARGHLRTLSRVLGIDAAPLVATYDNTYADAPVDPRRVFESELATGHGGSIRSTRGGRNWSVLISAVMGAVLVWSVARLVLGGPAPVGNTPVLNQSGGITHAMDAHGKPVKVVLNAAHGGARLVVRDANGHVVLDGPLAFGQSANLKAIAPVRIWSSDGSVTASIDGRPAKALGSTGEQASATLIAR